MSIRYQMKDHIMMAADYRTPSSHAHLASHIIISLGGKMDWLVNGENVSCHGICIGPNVEHVGEMPIEGALVFLFMEVSRYSMSLKEEYLKNRPYAVLPEEVIREVRTLYKERKEPSILDELVLKACQIRPQENMPYESRINAVVEYLNAKKTISSDIFDELSSVACLSKSRLSHLFKEQTGMTLHSYVAFTKLKKADSYVYEGCSVTEACMRSGFDSPSHCAATMKRMFGLSFRDIYKTMER